MKNALLGFAAVGAVVGLRRVAQHMSHMHRHCVEMATQCKQMATQVGGHRQPVGKT